jgi:hypothetical protein
MLTLSHWRSKTAGLMALGISSAALLPLLTATPTFAQSESYRTSQLFPQQSSVRVPAGTVIPVRYDEAEKIVVTPDETAPITLTVAEDVRSSRGTVLIRAGSQIAGELRPDDGGTRFFAETLTPEDSDRALAIDATSDVITETETITEDSDPDILRGAAIGAAAAAVLAEIFGSIDFLEVLAGAGLGVLAEVLLNNNDKEVEVVVVNSATDLDLTLQSDFLVR